MRTHPCNLFSSSTCLYSSPTEGYTTRLNVLKWSRAFDSTTIKTGCCWLTKNMVYCYIHRKSAVKCIILHGSARVARHPWSKWELGTLLKGTSRDFSPGSHLQEGIKIQKQVCEVWDCYHLQMHSNAVQLPQTSLQDCDNFNVLFCIARNTRYITKKVSIYTLSAFSKIKHEQKNVLQCSAYDLSSEVA